MTLLAQLVLFLSAAVFAVLVARKLRLTAVLGYLAAGLLIGPQGAGLFTDVDAVLHYGELGVVLLLFIIGLELQPSRLWVMRRAIFGLGGAQVLLCAAGIALAGLALGLDMTAALTVGIALSLSSTAFALQLLAERRELTTRHGRAAFSVLLFQDIAAIPVIGLLPLIAARAENVLFSTALVSIAEVAAAIVGVVLVGRYVLRHLFRFIAETGVHEAFTALALLTVVGTALVMEASGLSAAFGAFLAGVLLADSEYRHEIEANLDPFRGLLLGLFFIAVGMSVDLGILLDRPLEVAAAVVGLMVFKAAVLYGLGRLNGLKPDAAAKMAATIAQGGEFAFVIFGVAARGGILDADLADFLVLAVTVSMAVTPLGLVLQDILFQAPKAGETPSAEPMPLLAKHVIIAGFGRYGQIIGRILQAKGIPFTALEKSTSRIGFVRRYGNKIYYGDTARPELLRAAGAEQAAAFVLAIDDVDHSIASARTVRRHFPTLPIYARARHRSHALALMEAGVTHVQREMFLSSIDTSRHLLVGLGISVHEADRLVDMFKDLDVRRLRDDFEHARDEDQMAESAKAWADELEAQFARDEEERRLPQEKT